MLIEFTTSVVDGIVAYYAGDQIEIEIGKARGFIAAGHAVPVAEPLEAATVKPAENNAMQSHKPNMRNGRR